MSACSASESGVVVIRRAGTCAAVVLSLLAGAPAGSAPAAGGGDTARVQRIRVDETGVHVERESRRDRKGIRIEADVDGGPRTVVRIDGKDDTLGGSHVTIGRHIQFESDGSDRVRMFSDVEVGENEEVDGDVVALFGSVDVRGRVTGNVVAVVGSVRMHPGARIDGDAVAVGGVLDQPADAEIGGESVSVGFLEFSPWMPPFAMLFVIVIAGWLISVFMGWLLWLVFPSRMLRVAATASRHTGVSLLLGILFPPLAVMAAVLLSITVIGLPLALLVPMGGLFVGWAGQVATAYLVGSRLMRRPLGHGGPLAPILAGSLVVAALLATGALLAVPQGFVRSLAVFPLVVGLIVATVMGTIGTGAVLRSMFGTQPIDVTDPERGAPVLAPPAAATGPAPTAPTA